MTNESRNDGRRPMPLRTRALYCTCLHRGSRHFQRRFSSDSDPEVGWRDFCKDCSCAEFEAMDPEATR